MNKRAFTLIELLVVVLIIGILAAIALPQYEKAVYKSRLSEVMVNIKAIENCIDEYVLTNGMPASGGAVNLKDMGCSTELSGGEWRNNNSGSYYTENAWYKGECLSTYCSVSIHGEPLSSDPTASFYAYSTFHTTSPSKFCYTNKKLKGRVGCQMLQQTLGYEYRDAID